MRVRLCVGGLRDNRGEGDSLAESGRSAPVLRSAWGIDWTPYPIYYFDPRAYNLKVTS